MFDANPSRTLHPNMRWIWILRGVIITTVLTAVAIGVAAVVSMEFDDIGVVWWPAALIAIIGMTLSWIWAGTAWRRWRWDVTGVALTLHHGVMTRRVTALPFFRIQHIDAHQGPLDRLMGMSQLQVHTASISAQLPGIDADEATALRKELLDRAARAAAEVTDGSVDAV